MTYLDDLPVLATSKPRRQKKTEAPMDYTAGMKAFHRQMAISSAVNGWLQDVSLDDAIALWYQAQGAKEAEAQRQQENALRRKKVQAAMRGVTE